MESAGLVADALGRVRDMVRDALKDLSAQELLLPPKPHIAWLVWHLSRVQDANFSGLLERPQLWIADGWHARFNIAPEPRDYGSGHRQTPAQVEAFTVTDKKLLLELSRRGLRRAPKSYLSAVSNADLNRVLDEPQYQPQPTVSMRLASVINCNTRHAGQIEYLRGLVKSGRLVSGVRKSQIGRASNDCWLAIEWIVRGLFNVTLEMPRLSVTRDQSTTLGWKH